MGIVITAVWIVGGIGYVIWVGRSAGEQLFTLDVIGGFLEGAFAPLAFLWLVIGLFIQQKELAANSEALRRTSVQSEKQTQAIAATEMNARQETFFKIRDSVYQQLGGVTGLLYTSSMGPAGTGLMSVEEMDATFQRVADGDHEAFARLFLTKSMLEDVELTDLFFGTDIRSRHTAHFMQTFDRLRQLARNCDVDGIIESSLTQNSFGLLYRLMRDNRPGAAESA